MLIRKQTTRRGCCSNDRMQPRAQGRACAPAREPDRLTRPAPQEEHLRLCARPGAHTRALNHRPRGPAAPVLAEILKAVPLQHGPRWCLHWRNESMRWGAQASFVRERPERMRSRGAGRGPASVRRALDEDLEAVLRRDAGEVLARARALPTRRHACESQHRRRATVHGRAIDLVDAADERRTNHRLVNDHLARPCARPPGRRSHSLTQIPSEHGRRIGYHQAGLLRWRWRPGRKLACTQVPLPSLTCRGAR